MFQDYPDIVNIKQLGEMLGIGRASAYSLLHNELIPHVRVGRRYIITKDAVIGFVNQSCYNDEQKNDGRLTLVEKGDNVC